MADDVDEVLIALDLSDVVLAATPWEGWCACASPGTTGAGGTRIGAIALIGTSGGLACRSQLGRLSAAVSRVAGPAWAYGAGQDRLPTGDTGYLASRIGFGRRARPVEVVETLRMLRATEPKCSRACRRGPRLRGA